MCSFNLRGHTWGSFLVRPAHLPEPCPDATSDPENLERGGPSSEEDWHPQEVKALREVITSFPGKGD